MASDNRDPAAEVPPKVGDRNKWERINVRRKGRSRELPGGHPPFRLDEPGWRIGQRGNATRAPTQVPRPGWAAGRRPSASRDWPKSDKFIYSSCSPLNDLLRLRSLNLFDHPDTALIPCHFFDFT